MCAALIWIRGTGKMISMSSRCGTGAAHIGPEGDAATTVYRSHQAA